VKLHPIKHQALNNIDKLNAAQSLMRKYSCMPMMPNMKINLQKKLLTPSCDDIVEYGWDNNFYKLIDVTELLTNFTLNERSRVQTFLLSLSNLLN
jgi:hypothetical protein